VQIDPPKTTLKPPGTKRLKLKYDKLLSICFIFYFNFNLRRYTKEFGGDGGDGGGGFLEPGEHGAGGRGLRSSTFRLNLSRFCHTSTCPPV